MNGHPERPSNASTLVEVTQLDLRYEGCRLKSPAAEDRLLAGIAQVGIQEPLQGVQVGGVRILLNGSKRLRCAQKLHLTTVSFVALATDEMAGILCLLGATNEHALSLLEQARFLDELKGVGGLERGRDRAAGGPQPGLGESAPWRAGGVESTGPVGA